MGDDVMWGRVGALTGWLDSEVPEDMTRREVQLLRVLKIGEEFGETAEAIHGALGANPRKGASHTMADVEKELADTIVTAMVALSSISGDAEAVLSKRLEHLVTRVGLEPAPAS